MRPSEVGREPAQWGEGTVLLLCRLTLASLKRKEKRAATTAASKVINATAYICVQSRSARVPRGCDSVSEPKLTLCSWPGVSLLLVLLMLTSRKKRRGRGMKAGMLG